MRGAWFSDMVWRREDLNGALEERQVCVRVYECECACVYFICMCGGIYLCLIFRYVVVCLYYVYV